ncbi:MAG TPA: hypothetical protein VGX23_26805 [Actinocrinis sp.]|nr:hypothetical protein [Actinocrinis sp.]
MGTSGRGTPIRRHPRTARSTLVALLAATLLSGCGSFYPRTNTQPLPANPVVPVTARIRHPYIPPPPPPPPPDPGTLPQTTVLPRSDDPAFQAGALALWRSIVTGDVSAAQSFFFPETAYVQVKGIWNPQEDYQDRLITWYDLDIRAAHDHLGADAAAAQLLGVQVPTEQAEWIEPGVEYNKGSYYRVYGTRLAYRLDGQTHSIGIFSLISWRGEWYVVHLGPSTRPATEGIVFDPA